MRIEFYPFVFDRDWPLAKQELGLRYVEDTTGIICVDLDRMEPIGAVFFQMWSWNSCQAHIWVGHKAAIKRGLINEGVNYVFNTCGRNLIVLTITADNHKSLALNKHLGFRETHRIKDGFKEGVDWVIMEGNRHDLARWLDPKAPVVQLRRVK